MNNTNLIKDASKFMESAWFGYIPSGRPPRRARVDGEATWHTGLKKEKLSSQNHRSGYDTSIFLCFKTE